MLKNIFFLILFGFSIILPQRSRPVYFEDHIIPADSQITYYLSYRIPYNNLVFVKQNGSYTSGITLNVEAKNSESKEFFRESTFNSVEAGSYEDTESENDYAEGVVKLILPAGDYSVFPSLKINNIQRDINFKPLKINSSKIKKFLDPFVVSNETVCGEDENLLLRNFAGDIPFSAKESKLLIAAIDSVKNNLSFKIIQKDKLIFEETIIPVEAKNIIIEECENGLALKTEEGGDAFYLYELKGLSSRLIEGKAKIEIYKEEKFIDTLNTGISWIEKPASLYDMKSAIENLSLIAESEDIKRIKSAEEDERYEAFLNYWKSFDPTPETSYNEIMAEFYGRVDEADEKFAPADDTKGSKTDRGEIYIKYGEPDSVNRFSSDEYASVELWKYTDLNLEFYFADNSGLGNFRLIE